MNLKQIATTIALLGSGALALSGCEKDPPATEVPGGEGGDAEASCAADDHPADGHCGGDAAGGADEAVGDADDGLGEEAADDTEEE
jgi:hypothetical protein